MCFVTQPCDPAGIDAYLRAHSGTCSRVFVRHAARDLAIYCVGYGFVACEFGMGVDPAHTVWPTSLEAVNNPNIWMKQC